MMIKQFRQLIDSKSEIQKNLPKEARVSPCYLDADHQNQEGYLCADIAHRLNIIRQCSLRKNQHHFR